MDSLDDMSSGKVMVKAEVSEYPIIPQDQEKDELIVGGLKFA